VSAFDHATEGFAMAALHKSVWPSFLTSKQQTNGRIVNPGGGRESLAMRPLILACAVLAAMAETPASALAYDPYPWCAQYSGDGGGTNCGFLTIAQCRATVSGIGGFCVPNQFYNPGGGRSSRYRYS
jgi:hypothetical protein